MLIFIHRIQNNYLSKIKQNNNKTSLKCYKLYNTNLKKKSRVNKRKSSNLAVIKTKEGVLNAYRN